METRMREVQKETEPWETLGRTRSSAVEAAVGKR